MNWLRRIIRSNFFIKLRSWEYWPFGILHFPFMLYWLWLAVRARAIFFFSASNPSILCGGMMGESKFDVLNLVPKEVKPNTSIVRWPATAEEVMRLIRKDGHAFPLIFKPDLGERGWMVRKIRNEDDVKPYLKEIKVDFLIQELVQLPLEFGVFYTRLPSEPAGKVISITGKEMLSVTGNGKDSLEKLVMRKDRAKLHSETLKVSFATSWNEIIPDQEKFELVSIGNHCLGTTFLNENRLITPRLNESFDRLSKKINGFYFGRYDLRCASLADLENAKIMVMELNGCGAEPAHIYHPGFPLWEGLKVLATHWKTMFRISVENHQRGAAYLPYREGRLIYRNFKSIKKS